MSFKFVDVWLLCGWSFLLWGSGWPATVAVLRAWYAHQATLPAATMVNVHVCVCVCVRLYVCANWPFIATNVTINCRPTGTQTMGTPYYLVLPHQYNLGPVCTPTCCASSVNS
jgi:hypothetical protein